MNTINSSTADYLGFTQKLVKRNTATELINAKQSGEPVDKEKIKQSNQEIKDNSLDASLAIYQANIKKNTVDTYIRASENADNSYSSVDQEQSEINTFDAEAVNDARSTAQKRAIGISVYEKIQSISE